MAVGSGGHWRDSAGGQLATTSYAAFNFATQVRNQDSAYTKPSDSIIQFAEAGDYLVMWTIEVLNNSNARCNVQSFMNVDTGSGASFTTHHTGYSRNNSDAWIFTHGVGFIRAAASDQVSIHWKRDTDSMGVNGSSANNCSVTVVRLWDSGNYGIYTHTASGDNLGGITPNDAGFNNIVLESDTTTIERQSGSTDFRVKKDRRYLIAYSVAGNTGGNRTQRVSQVVDGSTLIPGTQSYCFQRNSANEFSGLGGMFIYDGDGTDNDLSIQVYRGDGELANEGGAADNGSWAREGNTGGLFIAEIPNHVECFGTHDETGAQDVTSTSVTDINAARTVDFIDAASFEKVNNQQVKAVLQMDAIICANMVTARANILSTARATINCYFELGGAAFQASAAGAYTRGVQAPQDTFGGGFNPGMIAIGHISADETIEIVTDNLGSAGGDDSTRPNGVGMFGINADTFVAPVTADKGTPKGTTLSLGSQAGDTFSLGATKGITRSLGAEAGTTKSLGARKGDTFSLGAEAGTTEG